MSSSVDSEKVKGDIFKKKTNTLHLLTYRMGTTSEQKCYLKSVTDPKSTRTVRDIYLKLL